MRALVMAGCIIGASVGMALSAVQPTAFAVTPAASVLDAGPAPVRIALSDSETKAQCQAAADQIAKLLGEQADLEKQYAVPKRDASFRTAYAALEDQVNRIRTDMDSWSCRKFLK